MTRRWNSIPPKMWRKRCLRFSFWKPNPGVFGGPDFSGSLTFNKRGYERRRFVYLTAIIAIALTNRVREDDRFADVVLHLRRRIQAEMQSRWDDTTDSSDKAIDEAAQDCARLLFTPPSEDRALSLTWPQEWMKECGADVTNPVTLFKMSYSWKQQYLVVAEFVRRVILRQD